MTLNFEKVFVAGHRGMVGAAVLRRFASLEHSPEILTRSRSELDLTRQSEVEHFFEAERPDAVVFAAAKVGGIHANNTYPAEFIYDNLAMAANTIHAAYRAGCPRFLFLGSTCIYPKHAPQPMPEECLLTGPLEPTNEAYAVAKIAGLKLCQHYRAQYGVAYHSANPTNLYGPGDNYHPENSHVLPALIRRFHEAKQRGDDSVTIWGTGTPRREFLHVDDLAGRCWPLALIGKSARLGECGTGSDVTILELAQLVAETVGYQGKIETDLTKPDGTPVKRTTIEKIESTGWSPTISLVDGMRRTYQDFLRETSQQEVREV